MSILDHKTFIPTATKLIRVACHFVVKYRATLVVAAEALAPGQGALVSDAVDGIVAACAVFESVETLYDPNN